MSLIGPPDLSTTVRRFSFPVTVQRFGESTTSTLGYRSAGPTRTRRIAMHVSPPGVGITTEMLPQGAVMSDARLGWTTVELRVASSETGARADEVSFAGETYKVVSVRPYRQGPAGDPSHFEVLLVMVDRADPSPLPSDPP